MAYAVVDGMRLYYEVAGRGFPVVLIAGLGADGHFWHKQVAALSREWEVITVDNRDTHRSRQATTPYTVTDMAEDIRGLLDALEISAAHVVGASLGGFVAQELALAHPHRVRMLVLCCTSFGGTGSAPIPSETLAVLSARTGDPAQDLRDLFAVSFATDYPQTHAEEVEEFIAWRLVHPQALDAYRRQLTAALGHDTADRLGGLPMPALILHGGEDRVVPVANAHLLLARIPRARLHVFPDAGHLFLWERADEANRFIAEFLRTD